MRLSLRKFLACLLLMVLPLQAMALTSNCCGAAAQPAQEMANQMPEGCNHHDKSAAADDASSKQVASHDGMHAEHGQGSACGMSGGCILVVAALPDAPRFPVPESAPQSLPAVSSQFTSFIPDGLHRPPNFLS